MPNPSSAIDKLQKALKESHLDVAPSLFRWRISQLKNDFNAAMAEAIRHQKAQLMRNGRPQEAPKGISVEEAKVRSAEEEQVATQKINFLILKKTWEVGKLVEAGEIPEIALEAAGTQPEWTLSTLHENDDAFDWLQRVEDALCIASANRGLSAEAIRARVDQARASSNEGLDVGSPD